MKLYTVIGKKDCGKTTLIKRIAIALTRQNDYSVICANEMTESRVFRSREDIASAENRLENELANAGMDAYEMKGIIEIGGKRIGIYSVGDATHFIRDSIYFFRQNHCDIGIHAAHPTRTHLDCLNAMVAQSDDIEEHNLLSEFDIAPDSLNELLETQIEEIALRILA